MSVHAPTLARALSFGTINRSLIGCELVHAALGHQEMEVYVKVDPVPEGLDSRGDPGRKRAPGRNLEITGQGPEGAAAEIAEEPALVLEEDPQHLRRRPRLLLG